jgi:general secretion pathway protein G
MQKRDRKGFTLIELLVVIAIIGILSTLAVVALNSARQRSRDAKRVSDVRQIQTALELGFSETSTYPSGSDIALGTANYDVLCNNGGASTFQADTTGCTTIYMGLVPTSPTPNASTYNYNSTTGSAAYSLTFTLEGATGQLAAGDQCANQNGIQAGTTC